MTPKGRADHTSDPKARPPGPVCQLKRAPVAPPVYRPQPEPRVLQRKLARDDHQTPASKSAQPAAAPAATTKRAVKISHKPAISRPAPRVAQRKAIANTNVSATKTVIQRMEGRPHRAGINYEINYSASAPSDLQNLTEFVRLAKAHIANLKRTVTLQPERNLPKEERGEQTNAYIMVKAMRYTISSGSSGGNQHGEMRALDAANWKSSMQGYQYYFVCDGGKPSCYLCTAIASLLKLAVAGTDDSTYSDYVAPDCLQTDDDLWQRLIGDEAHKLWLSFTDTRRNRLRINLGWVHNLGLYWQG